MQAHIHARVHVPKPARSIAYPRGASPGRDQGYQSFDKRPHSQTCTHVRAL